MDGADFDLAHVPARCADDIHQFNPGDHVLVQEGSDKGTQKGASNVTNPGSGGASNVTKLTICLIIFAVVASSIHWQWTPDPMPILKVLLRKRIGAEIQNLRRDRRQGESGQTKLAKHAGSGAKQR